MSVSEATIEAQYEVLSGNQSVRQFALMPNDMGHVPKSDIISLLPFQILKQGVQFSEDIYLYITVLKDISPNSWAGPDGGPTHLLYHYCQQTSVESLDKIPRHW